jgi:pimeloyl-ACP methyl ester carboxylesterase
LTRIIAIVLAIVLALVPACKVLFRAPTPMRSIEFPQPGPQLHAKCAIVFLPGFGDSADDFADKGFVTEVRKRGLSVDIVAAQATFGYYIRGAVMERLAADVVEPLRARGHEHVWLIGMSMGGMGTLMYSRTHADEIEGVLALAPYLGDDSIAAEVKAQGGLAAWKGPSRVDVLTDDNYQREIWRWLQALLAHREKGPDLYLGFGNDDKLRREDSVLAAAMPADHQFHLPGTHDWPTWRLILAEFLDHSAFTTACRGD